MDPVTEEMFAPVFRDIEDNTGVPPTEAEKLCVLRGYIFAQNKELERDRELYNQTEL